jgi:hypothetical protein
VVVSWWVLANANVVPDRGVVCFGLKSTALAKAMAGLYGADDGSGRSWAPFSSLEAS